MFRQLNPWIRYSRARLRRSRLAHWLAAVVAAVVIANSVSGTVGRAQAEAARFRPQVTVAVITRSVATGRAITDADFERRPWPRSLLPDSVPVADPVGRVALADLVPGDVVVAARVAPDGLRGNRALLPRGRKALAVARGVATPRVRPGDWVDVLATFEPGAAGDEDPTFAVARRSLVIDVGDEAVTVAVTADEAPRVAYALAVGTVTLVLT